VYEDSFLLTTSPTFVVGGVLDGIPILIGVRWNLSVVLIHIPLMARAGHVLFSHLDFFF
jgi:hypothetical protein